MPRNTAKCTRCRRIRRVRGIASAWRAVEALCSKDEMLCLETLLDLGGFGVDEAPR
jgi:hypothetical protein